MTSAFDYDSAFARNLGWLTQAEQRTLRGKRVAIAGLGGVGGLHLLTLVRLGVGGFSLADFDTFDLVNFNRQVGASVSTIGQPKLDVMAAMARDINPTVELTNFSEGVTKGNVAAFLANADLFVDGLDFFAFEARELVFAECARRGIPATTVAPLGMGAALLNFMPGKMSFAEYFGFDEGTEEEKPLRFLIGLAPSMLHRRYLVDSSFVDLASGRGPSTGMACQICAGVAATEALKILLGRRRVLAAPHGVHFDAYRNKLRSTWRPGGFRHPMQRTLFRLARRQFARIQSSAPRQMGVCEQVLDLARWAPSGDNTQPWRFEIRSNLEILIHGYDTRDHCVYDLDGWASQLAHGALLETMTLAATRFACRAQSSIVSERENGDIVYRVVLEPDPAVVEDPLVTSIRDRVVQRRPMWPKQLLAEHRLALERAVQPYTVIWWDSWSSRGAMASLNARNAHIRLTIPEAFSVHKAVIAWNCETSEDRLPAASLGADPILLGVMRWVMGSWERASFFNRYLGGTVMPRLLLDFLPGVLCSGHFAILGPSEPRSTADRVAAGRAVQRFWLTATKLNLQVQPSYTPLVFARYAREHRHFTRVEQAHGTAREIERRLEDLLGADEVRRTVFLGRFGPARAVKGRSLRLPVDRLMVDQLPVNLTASTATENLQSAS